MRIKKLNIQGFGKFVKPFEMDFADEGIQVIIGSNESGKSTILQSILAILFGISNREKRRFQSWGIQGVSTGFVTFTDKDYELLIERDFSTDMVGCVEISNGKEKPIFSDRDRTGSRSERSYLRMLTKFLPIIDPLVFSNTTFLSQEQIDVKIPTSLKQLITGASETNIDELLESFRDDYFKITLDGGKIKRPQKNQDRLLEQLQKEFEEKNHILENLRNSFADLNEIQKEIENLQSELIATNISIEKQTEEVTNIERLCEHLHDIRNVSETHKEVYSQKDSINKIEEEIKRLKKELTNKFPQLSDFNGVEVNEDITKYRAYLSNIDQLKNETDKIILQKDEIIEQIRNNYQIYANAGKEFYQDLTKLKELEETKAPKLTNIKKLMENHRDFKNKYLMQSMGFYTSVIVFSIITMFVLDAFTLSISSVLTGGFIFFVVATFIIYYWVLNPMKKVVKEMDSQISVSEAELMKSRIEIDELLSKYFNVPELENYEHHFKNIEAYELLNQNISEIDTKLNLLDIQMNKSEIQEMMAVIKNKYEGVIDFSDENLDENIERFIEIQQELKAKQEALETHKKSDYLNDRDHELTVEIAKTNTLVQEILRDSPHLQRFVDDAAKLNEELRKSEQQLEKLGAKQNAIESDLNEKKLVLARMEGNEDIDMERIVEDIQQIEEQIDYLSKKRSALAVVITTLESSVEEYNRIYKDSLNQRMNKYFEKIIGHDRFTVKLDDKFQLNIYHEDDIIPEESLSLGTRDQLYLSMRLAFSEEIAGDTNLPFFLDDPFVNCDEERLKCIKNILHDINKEHQVVIFSIDQKYSDWGKNVIYLKNE